MPAGPTNMAYPKAIEGQNAVSLVERIDLIARYWTQATTSYVESVLEVGRILIATQEEHGKSLREMAEKLPFDWSTASKLMKIAETFDVAQRATAFLSALPASWSTMYELTKLRDLDAALAAGRIHREMTREDAIALNPNGIAGLPGARIKVPEGKTLSGWIIVGLALEESEELNRDQAAQRIDLARLTYHHGRDIVLLADMKDLDKTDAEKCQSALALMDSQQTIKTPYEMVKDIATRVWGSTRGSKHNAETITRLTEAFEQSVMVICQACQAELKIPQLNQAKIKSLVADLTGAKEAITTLIGRLREKIQ